MILAIVPHPALDKTMVISGFRLGQTHRAEVLTLAGGKGFNVARALHTLGQESLVIAPLGGHGGQYLRDLAHRDGLDCVGPELATEVRTCLTIIDPADDYRVTEVYEQGSALPASAWEQIIECAESHFAQASLLVVCGSFPPGVPAGGLAGLLELARTANLPILLDTYGPQLEQALRERPDLLKINQYEAGALLDQTITTPREASIAACLLRARGARAVVITLGRQGAVGVTESGEPFGWAAPQVAALSSIGSGDCLLAGIAAGLERGERLAAATRLGVAAGAANTLHIGAGRLESQQVMTLLPQVRALELEG